MPNTTTTTSVGRIKTRSQTKTPADIAREKEKARLEKELKATKAREVAEKAESSKQLRRERAARKKEEAEVQEKARKEADLVKKRADVEARKAAVEARRIEDIAKAKAEKEREEKEEKRRTKRIRNRTLNWIYRVHGNPNGTGKLIEEKEAQGKVLQKEVDKMDLKVQRRLVKERKCRWEDGQKTSLLSLPVEVLENCFGLEQDLSLADHVALSQTCKAFRGAYDDQAWTCLLEKASTGLIADYHDGASETTLILGSKGVSFNRCDHLRAIMEEMKSDTKRAIKFGSNRERSTLSRVHRLGNLVEEMNRLHREYKPSPTLDYQAFPQGPQDASEPGYNDKVRSLTEARNADYAKRKNDYEEYLKQCAHFQAKRLSLTRGHLHSIGGTDAGLMLDVGIWDYGEAHVFVLRKVNLPFYTLMEAQKRLCMGVDQITALLKSIPKEWVRYANAYRSTKASESYYLARDVDRLRDSLKRDSEIYTKKAALDAELALLRPRYAEAKRLLALVNSGCRWCRYCGLLHEDPQHTHNKNNSYLDPAYGAYEYDAGTDSEMDAMFY